MKKPFSILVLVTFCLLLFSTQCNEDTGLSQIDEELQLKDLKSEIEDLANTSTCGDGFECTYIAFGSKPCGGPWSYLIYSTSIDTETLEELVENYNRKESLYNELWGIVSDCAVAIPPTTVSCENNACVAVY
ncbi:hypothetical protein FPF71_00370 [Algibacter amylolyticus]|uniref:Uncharacterized protein n=1 Tax=Algibacter amylolyticus TaxID=1608400 RepID=A0A5M7BHR5_9FLAO|nr:hypothetical protein [Algibacter amylolyticus]KAA5827334.1 hypothetical protein F2B50_00370 [Algibacter amylolyticus]MBB5266520.1 hypothetical protein [Algibacter amylolyticus]TSJ81579.1 hypothetical protein FPF71_00370 [Algibacter amylolyticus]